MEKIELVTLLPGSIPFSDGNINSTWRGHAHGSRGTIELFIKRVSARELLVEVVAAQLGRSLSLPIPRPMLVRVLPMRSPTPIEREELFFGSESADYPSLLRQANIKLDMAIERLRKWPHLLMAGCFDEWIGNDDRHDGNILYGGGKTFVLIDHGRAFRQDMPTNRANKRNRFIEIARSNKSEVAKQKLLKSARENCLSSFAEKIQADWLKATQGNQYCSTEQVDNVVAFLTQRLDVLDKLISTQIKASQQEIFNESSIYSEKS